MACRLFCTKPLSKPVLVIINWTPRNKLQCNCNQNYDAIFNCVAEGCLTAWRGIKTVVTAMGPLSDSCNERSPHGQNGRHFADDIFRCIFVNENFVSWLKFHWSFVLRVQLTITQQWLRWWLGTEYAISHYLNQCWPDSLTHICRTRGRWLKNVINTWGVDTTVKFW